MIDEFNFAGTLHGFANQMLLLQDGNNNAGREQFITARGCRNCGEVKDEGSGCGGMWVPAPRDLGLQLP